MAILRVKSGTGIGTVYELSRELLVLGRDLEATIQVADQGVSRHHAEVIRVGELFLLRDCGSRNGTFINGERVSERALREGDRIRVGTTEFAFEDRPELLEESHWVQFHDRAFSPSDTLHLRTKGSLPAAQREPPPGRFRDSLLLLAMDRIAHCAAQESRLDVILRQSLAELGAAINARRVYVFNPDGEEEGELFRVVASWLAPGEDARGSRISNSVMQQACRDGEPLLIGNAVSDARFCAEDSIVTQQLESILCSPLKAQKQVFGVLYAADCTRGGSFTTEDLELFGAVATQLGLTIAFSRKQRQHDVFFKRVMRVLVAAIEHRLPETKGSSERVANLCAAMARAMHLDPQDVRYAWLAGLLHNVAALGLSDRELAESILLPIRRNRAAEELLAPLAGLEPVLEAILNQNERFDGGGAPHGKKGDSIPLLAQILGLAVAFDRLLSGDLAAGEALSVRDALLKLNETKDRQFPARAVNGLMVAYRRGELFKEDQHFNAAAF